MALSPERRQHDRRASSRYQDGLPLPKDEPTKPVEVSVVKEIFLKNVGTGLYRKGLSRRKKALREVKGVVMNCRDKDAEITVVDAKRQNDSQKS